MSFEAPQMAMPAIPAAPPPPPLLGSDASKKKPQAKSMQPSFLGTETAPTAAQSGGKTLLGQ